MLFDGTDEGYDLFDGGTGYDRAVAVAAGTVVGVNGYENGIEEFAGPGDTIIRDSYYSHTLDFSQTRLNGIAEVDAGSGNDTIIASDLSIASYRGNKGNDVLTVGVQAATWLYAGDENGYDTFNNTGGGTATALAEAAGTVIGIDGFTGGVDVFTGFGGGDTIIRDSYYSHTLDFSQTRLVDIAEVDAGSGNDTIVASDLCIGRYRGGEGNDTLHAGSQMTYWLYSGDENGYDNLQDNGFATAVALAESPDTVIGIASYENGVDAFVGHSDGDTIVRNSYYSHTLDFSHTYFFRIAEVDAGSGNDTIVASDLSVGRYRGGYGDDTLVAGTQPVVWLYTGEGDGQDSFEHNGNKNVTAVIDGETQTTDPIQGSTGTGLDQLVELISVDTGLNRKVDPAEIAEAAAAADAMNHIIVAAIKATGLANDDELNTADMYDLNAWIQANHYNEWVAYHGDDESHMETGFHLVQNDGATGYLFGDYNAVNTIADGLYHMGFDIVSGRFLNEDGNRNAEVDDVAHWLDTLLREELANGSLRNPDAAPYAHPTTGTGLDRLVEIITTDEALNERIATSDISAAARAADRMNEILIEAIKATGLANDGTLNAADVRDLNTYIQTHFRDEWIELHGDDACSDDCYEETGFHLVQNDGAVARLFGQNAVDTVADGIYHLGFDIVGDHVLNEDGNRNARVETIAVWLDELLADDLASGALANPKAAPTVQGSTGTGLDVLIKIISEDPGLNQKIATSEIAGGARLANVMNHVLVWAIKATGAGNDGLIDTYDMYDINAYLQAHFGQWWGNYHGNDEGDSETGFHKVQNDGASTYLFGANAVDTVADGIYHVGFDIENGYFLNEDGFKNVSVETVAWWINDLLQEDLNNGTLTIPSLAPTPEAIASAKVFSAETVVMETPDDYLEVSHTDDLALANGTVAFTFQADDVAERGTLFSKDASGYQMGGHLTAFVYKGRIEVRLQNANESVWLYSQSLIKADEPHHMAVSFGEDGFRLYVDGKLEDMESDFTTGIEANTENLVIGANAWARSDYKPDWTADYFEGTIDGFTIYNRALSRDEVWLIGGGVAVEGPTSGTTGTGLDTLVDIILDDSGLYRSGGCDRDRRGRRGCRRDEPHHRRCHQGNGAGQRRRHDCRRPPRRERLHPSPSL